MRLGSYEAKLKKGSLINSIYNSIKINERHRHRYEVNINFKDEFEKKGMIFSGLSPDSKLPEIIELENKLMLSINDESYIHENINVLKDSFIFCEKGLNIVSSKCSK